MIRHSISTSSIMTMITILVVCLHLSPVLSLSSSSSSCPCEEESLCEPVKNVPEKEIFIFTESNGPEIWPLYDWSKITTLGFCNYYKFPNLIELMCTCHKHSVRLVPLVSLGNGTTKDLPNPKWRQELVNNFTEFVKTYHLDGINFDLESPISPAQVDRRNGYTSLVLETKLSLLKNNPYAQVTVDVRDTPASSYRHYDYVALGLISDFLFIMDYDEGHGQPVSANSNYFDSKLGIKWYINIGVRPNKLLTGVPWYGYGWQCKTVTGDLCFPVEYNNHEQQMGHNSLLKDEQSEKLYFKSSVNSVPSYCYNLIVPILDKQPQSRKWNSLSWTPYFFFNDTGSYVRQMQYDDPVSLSLKSKLAVDLKLRGVGVWIMECLDWTNTTKAQNERQAIWDSLPAY